MNNVLKRLVVFLLAILIGLAGLAPAAQAADPAGPPVMVSAANASGAWINLAFDRQLKASQSIDLAKIAVGGAGGAYVKWAYSSGRYLYIQMNKPLVDVPSVTVSLAAGTVSSATDEPNAAIAGYKVQTLAGIIGILEAMQATTVNPDVRQVVKYLRTPNIGNVAGGEGIGREDVRFLTSLTSMATTGLAVMDSLIDQAEYLLTHAPADIPERAALQEKLAAAKSARQDGASTLHKLSKATLELSRAYDGYSRIAYLPTEPKVRSENGNVEIWEGYNDIPHRMLVPAGMTAEQLLASLASRHPFTIRASAAADAAVVTGSTTLAAPMVVRVDAEGGYVYAVKQLRPISSPAELTAAFADANVGGVRVLNDIAMPQDQVTVPRGMVFTADKPVLLTVRQLMTNGFSRLVNVAFAAHADNDEELRSVLSGLYDKITVQGLGDDNGTLSPRERMDGNSQYLMFFQQGSTAYVATKEQVKDALATTDITRIYLTNDITVDGVLTFPVRHVELAASSPRNLNAAGFANTGSVTKTNVALVEGTSSASFLHKIGTAAELDIINVSNTDRNRLYVPAGMTASELAAQLSSAYSFTVKGSVSETSAVVESGTTLANGMAVHVTAPGSKPYEIRLQKAVATASELASVLADSTVGSIRLANDIVMPSSVTIADKHVRAYAGERLIADAVTFGQGVHRDGVKFVGRADSDDKLLSLTGQYLYDEIIVTGIGAAYDGTLIRKGSSDFFFAKGGIAYVGNPEHLIDALADASIDTIYVVADVAVSGPLTFPNADIKLEASVSRKVTATTIHNRPATSHPNVELVDTSIPAGVTASIGDLVVDGNLLRFNVNFSEAIEGSGNPDPIVEDLLESVTFFGAEGYGWFDWPLVDLDVEWTDADTLEIGLGEGVAYDGQYIMVDFKDNAIVGISGEALANDPALYPTANILFPRMENVTITNHELNAFDIRFSTEMSDATRGKNAAEIISSVNLHKGSDSIIPLQVSSLTASWPSKDVLHVSIPNGSASDDWDFIKVALTKPAVTGSGGETLIISDVYYAQLPSVGLYGEITSFHDIEAVSIDIQFSEPVKESIRTAEGGHLALIESVTIMSGTAETWTPQNTDMSGSGWLDEYTYNIHFVPDQMLPFAESVEVTFNDDVIFSEVGTELASRHLSYSIAEPVGSDTEIMAKAADLDTVALKLSDAFGSYAGLYVRDTAAEAYHFTSPSGTAIVYHIPSFLDAMNDEDVSEIYLADSLTFPEGYELALPERITGIGAATSRSITAGIFVESGSLSLTNVTLNETFAGVPVTAKIKPQFDMSSIGVLDLYFNQPLKTELAAGVDVIDSVVLTYGDGSPVNMDIPISEQTWRDVDRLELDWTPEHTTTGLTGITVTIKPNTLEGVGGSMYAGGPLYLNLVPMSPQIQNVQHDGTNITSFDVVFDDGANAISEQSVDLGSAAVTDIFGGYSDSSSTVLAEGDYSVSYNEGRTVMTVTLHSALPTALLQYFQVSFDREHFISTNGNYLGNDAATYTFVS